MPAGIFASSELVLEADGKTLDPERSPNCDYLACHAVG